MTNGIYTFANDVVYDQLVALLNSIEANVSPQIPVCVIPYDSQLDQVRAEIVQRNNVTLFEDSQSIAYWEDFANNAWKTHPEIQKTWHLHQSLKPSRLARHRKLCCFDGPFEKFVYFDADTLALGPLDDVYQKLDEYDWVTNDYQHRSALHHIFECPEEEILKVFNRELLGSHIFCSGWFASKKGVFNRHSVKDLLEKLQGGEANLLSVRCIDQPLLNYMVLRSEVPYYNFAYAEKAPGSHWSSKFKNIDQVLYDKGQRLTYLHYMSISSSAFTQVCVGEDVEIPYRDLFLYYRYLKSPEQCPKLIQPSVLTRLQRTLQSFSSKKMDGLKRRLKAIQG